MISILIVMVIPGLLMDGMFMDGEQYACISANLYNNIGSFWKPILSQTWYMKTSPYFMEQPPLFYWLESSMFYLFADSEYSERMFSILMLIINAVIIHKLWKLVFLTHENLIQKSWLPLFLWIITPICFWTFQNNMIEMVVSAFCLLAVYFGYSALVNNKFRYFKFLLAGCMIVLGFLTKGFPAFFPVVMLLAYYFSFKTITLKQAVLYSFYLISVIVILLLCIVFSSNEAYDYFHFYIIERLLDRLEATATTNYRILLIVDLISELIPAFAITVLFFAFEKMSFFKLTFSPLFRFFLILGLAGSLPLMLTLVQKKFYFMPSIPFFAMALSVLIVSNSKGVLINYLNTEKRKKVVHGAVVFLFFLSIVLSACSVGKYSRDEKIIADVKTIGVYLKTTSVISTDINTHNDWSFNFYLLRKFKISLDPNIKRSNYFVSSNTNFPNSFYNNYSKVNIPTLRYHLFITRGLNN